MNVVVIVQARMGSSRLPGKVLKPAGGKPLLAHQVDRLRQVRHARAIVVATTDCAVDDEIARACDSIGVMVVRGSEHDVLSRYALAAEFIGAEVVVRLTADCPVIDPGIVDEAIATYLAASGSHRYVSNTMSRTYPRGMDVEVFSRELLDEAHREAVTRYDREHVTPYIRRSLSGAGCLTSITSGIRLDGLRLTVDYPSDYENIKVLLESGLPDYSLATLLSRAGELGLDLRESDSQLREHSNPLGRVGLGAAQFGMQYGRFNVNGQPSIDSVGEILAVARSLGLSAIDTAHLYGQSEAALGRCFETLRNFEIVTKTPRFAHGPIGAEHARALRAAFAQSLDALRLPAVHGLLVHHAPNLLAPGGERLYDEMRELKQNGRVSRIGVSVYSGEIAEEIHARFPLDMVQLPLNLMDQRALASGAIKRLSAAGVRVQVRSAFLQGLLLAEPEQLPPHFAPSRAALGQLRNAAQAAGVSPAQAALHFLLGIPELDRIIIGVDSLSHLEQLFMPFPPAPVIDYSAFAIDNAEILNPTLWPK